MQVNAFIRRKASANNPLLVLPISPDAAPPLGMERGWMHFATTDTKDAMFRSVQVEQAITTRGYCVFEP